MTQSSPPHVRTLDEEGLLCALVVAPSTYSRNRHFALYESGAMKRVLRRARAVKSLVREIVRIEVQGEGSLLFEPAAGGTEVTLDVPTLGYQRRALLTPIEHALVEYLLARRQAREAPAARRLVEGALVRLAGSSGFAHESQR